MTVTIVLAVTCGACMVTLFAFLYAAIQRLDAALHAARRECDKTARAINASQIDLENISALLGELAHSAGRLVTLLSASREVRGIGTDGAVSPLNTGGITGATLWPVSSTPTRGAESGEVEILTRNRVTNGWMHHSWRHAGHADVEEALATPGLAIQRNGTVEEGVQE